MEKQAPSAMDEQNAQLGRGQPPDRQGQALEASLSAQRGMSLTEHYRRQRDELLVALKELLATYPRVPVEAMDLRTAGAFNSAQMLVARLGGHDSVDLLREAAPTGEPARQSHKPDSE